MAEVCKDSILGNSEASSQALEYLSTTYRCIYHNLRDADTVSDSTIAAVMSMALHEDFRGQPGRSKVHIDALERLVDLRGGITALEIVLILVQKICR
jgi:hypothetical protein